MYYGKLYNTGNPALDAALMAAFRSDIFAADEEGTFNWEDEVKNAMGVAIVVYPDPEKGGWVVEHWPRGVPTRFSFLGTNFGLAQSFVDGGFVDGLKDGEDGPAIVSDVMAICRTRFLAIRFAEQVLSESEDSEGWKRLISLQPAGDGFYEVVGTATDQTVTFALSRAPEKEGWKVEIHGETQPFIPEGWIGLCDEALSAISGAEGAIVCLSQNAAICLTTEGAIQFAKAALKARALTV